jgi:hypothetical protein
MKKRIFEEKQLSKNMIELDILCEAITGELDVIYKELERKGKWSDFVQNLESLPANKESYPLTDAEPENYYECLLLALTVIDKYDDFKTKVESAAKENHLIESTKVEEIELPFELLDHLNFLGISVGSKEPVEQETYEDKVCVFYLNSRNLIEGMEKALRTVRESKTYIFKF